MANQKTIDKANLELALSENNKKIIEYVNASDKELEDKISEIEQNGSGSAALEEHTTASNPHGITKGTIGLSNVDNTSDADKPISTAQQEAFDAKVPTTRKVNGKALSADITLSASDVNADASGTANTAVTTHNTATDSHNDIRLLISDLAAKLNALADSDDTTLDQMSEVVAYIKANKALIDSVTTSKVNTTDIINNLTTNVSDKPLSAAQGVAIKADIDALETEMAEVKKSVADGKALLADTISGFEYSTVASNATFEEFSEEIDNLVMESYSDGMNFQSQQIANGINEQGYITVSVDDIKIDMLAHVSASHEACASANYSQGVAATKKGTATADKVITGYTFTNASAVEVAGTMKNQGAASVTLNCGKSYTIPEGYHNGKGTVTANSLASQTDGTAVAGNILYGKIAYVDGVKVTGTMTDNGAISQSLNCDGSYTIPAGYHNGSGKVTANSLASQTSGTATAADMLSGKTAYVGGTKLTGTIASKAAATYTPGTTDQTISAGQYLSGAQTIKGDADLTAANIVKGKEIFGVTGTFSTEATSPITAANVLSGKIGFVNGSKITGTMTNNGAVSQSLNCSGSYTIPAGYHNGSGKVTANTLASQTSGTATAGEITANKIAWVNGVKVTGTMADKGAVSATLNCGESYDVPAGYHNGSGKVTANSLASQTSANATAAQILSGKTAWINGSKVTGTMANYQNNIPDAISHSGNGVATVSLNPGYYIAVEVDNSVPYAAGVAATKKGTATGAQVLTGYTFTNSSAVEASGAMANNGAVSQSLNCGGSYTIPAGYHNGSGKVTANSLASQTSANATAAMLIKGKTAWVGGSKITGTMTDYSSNVQTVTTGTTSGTTTFDIGDGFHTHIKVNNTPTYNAGYTAGVELVTNAIAEALYDCGHDGAGDVFDEATADSDFYAMTESAMQSFYNKGKREYGTTKHRSVLSGYPGQGEFRTFNISANHYLEATDAAHFVIDVTYTYGGYTYSHSHAFDLDDLWVNGGVVGFTEKIAGTTVMEVYVYPTLIAVVNYVATSITEVAIIDYQVDSLLGDYDYGTDDVGIDDYGSASSFDENDYV